MLRFLVVLLSVVVAGCGGGGSDPPPIALSSAGCANTIQLVGDSTQLLEGAYWQTAYGARVTNDAVGGTKLTQFFQGADGLNVTFPASVKGHWLAVKFGTNDGTSAYGRTPPAEFEADLRAIVAASAHVILETPDKASDPERSTSVPPYSAIVRKVAADTHTPLIDNESCMLANPDWPSLLTDGTHKTTDGRQWSMDHCVAPVIEKLKCDFRAR